MTPITVSDVVAWWKLASTEDREKFLMALGRDDAHPVTENVWYVYPVKYTSESEK